MARLPARWAHRHKAKMLNAVKSRKRGQRLDLQPNRAPNRMFSCLIRIVFGRKSILYWAKLARTPIGTAFPAWAVGLNGELK